MQLPILKVEPSSEDSQLGRESSGRLPVGWQRWDGEELERLKQNHSLVDGGSVGQHMNWEAFIVVIAVGVTLKFLYEMFRFFRRHNDSCVCERGVQDPVDGSLLS